MLSIALMALSLFVCIDNHTATIRTIARIGKGLSVGLPLALSARDGLHLLMGKNQENDTLSLTTPTDKVAAWVKQQIPEAYRDKLTLQIGDPSVHEGFKAEFGITDPYTI
jgi:hypothetical protein